MKEAEILKKIRINKQVSQAHLTQGVCSRSTLATFELKETSYLSSEYLFKFLERLNISLDEFSYYVKVDNEKQTCLNNIKYYRGLKSKGLNELKQISEECYVKFAQTNDIFWLIYAFKSSEMFRQQSDSPFVYQQFKQSKQHDLETLENYLMEVQNWNSFEFRIFGNIVQYLNSTYIQRILELLPTKLDLTYPPNHEILIKTILNMEIHFVEINEPELMQRVIDQTAGYFTYENLHYKILSVFLTDLLKELNTNKYPCSGYKYLQIYKEMGFDDYYVTLMNFRIRQLGKKQ
ncbi:Rgg/GadR/MutR family transcriptional regulator [Lapidilactobacillus bayanensis]|uniref:Rgg/GadR/MutR family transcriptional regulator n=1 Tax=Lapidilactobacillus bayanensis TaxID=2485998 RepID=UPI0013DD8AB3|nr:Rgg/GadR/MutR family transcriptional regulator [Lapidilactobacillus bayanensis]